MFSRVIAISKFFGIISLGTIIPFVVYGAEIKNPPFHDEEAFVLTRAYNDTSHVGKDKYALDFTQSGCSAFQKPIVVVEDGKIIKANSVDEWGNGY